MMITQRFGQISLKLRIFPSINAKMFTWEKLFHMKQTRYRPNMMKRIVEIDELGERMKSAQERLSHEREKILGQNNLSGDFSREEYTFAYMRAEQFGLKAIKKSLDEVAWLPLKLDPDTEMMSSNHTAMTLWLKNESKAQPTAENFGNDFIHAIARAAVVYGWDDIRVAQLSARIAHLFKDLSCLVGIAYYSAWITEGRIERIKLSNPDDLHKTVLELAAFMRATAPKVITPAKEQDDPGKKSKNKEKPTFLHVVKDEEEETDKEDV